MQELNVACNDFNKSVAAACVSHDNKDSQSLEQACSFTVEKLQQVLRCSSHLSASTSQQDPNAMDHDHSTTKANALKEVLDRLMSQLDGLSEGLYETLQELDSPAIAPAKFVPDPQEVITYAHRIRFTTFARVGTVSLPPAPQPWQLALSSLNAFGKAQAAALAAAGLAPSLAAHSAVMQAQMAAQAAAQAAQQAATAALVKTEPLPAAAAAAGETGAPPFPEGYVLQGGAVLPPQLAQPQQQQEAAPVPAPRAPVIGLPTSTAALDLLLNPDLEAVSEASSSDDDDDDWD